MNFWTSEEIKELKKLSLDGQRSYPEKMYALVHHFSENRSVWRVTQGDGPVRVSVGLARKVRDLVRDGKLDWVLEYEHVATGFSIQSLD